MADSEITRTLPAATTPAAIARRRLLGAIATAPAVMALPAAAAIATDDGAIVAACDRFWSIYNKPVTDEDFADINPEPCQSAAFAVARLPAATAGGVFAKVLISLESLAGNAVWDDALAASIKADIKRLGGMAA